MERTDARAVEQVEGLPLEHRAAAYLAALAALQDRLAIPPVRS